VEKCSLDSFKDSANLSNTIFPYNESTLAKAWYNSIADCYDNFKPSVVYSKCRLFIPKLSAILLKFEASVLDKPPSMPLTIASV